MVIKKQSYSNEHGYEILDQKRKRKVQEMKKLIHKYDIKTDELGLQFSSLCNVSKNQSTLPNFYKYNMKVQINKIIAREFLVFLLAVSIALISYIIIRSYNYFKQKEEDNLSQQIIFNNNFSDSLSKPLNTKMGNQLSFSNKYYKLYHSNSMENPVKYYSETGVPIMGDIWNLRIFERLKFLSQTDSISLLWKDTKDFEDFGRHFDFATLREFKIFVDNNIIIEDNVFRNTQSDSIVVKTKSLQLEKNSIKDIDMVFLFFQNCLLV